MVQMVQLDFWQNNETHASSLYPQDTPLWKDFLRFHEMHPDVYKSFEKSAFAAMAAGYTRIGAKFLMERIRWEMFIEKRDRSYRVQNNHFPYYARIFTINNPDCKGFFELRQIRTV